MTSNNEYLQVERTDEEKSGAEYALRPASLAEFVGQDKLKENLKIFISAAKSRGESLDHCLFYSPPGLGKTTLSNILAHEMGVNIKITSGPVLSRPGDLAAVYADPQKAGKLLGWQAELGIEDMCRDAWNWQRNNPRGYRT